MPLTPVSELVLSPGRVDRLRHGMGSQAMVVVAAGGGEGQGKVRQGVDPEGDLGPPADGPEVVDAKLLDIRVAEEDGLLVLRPKPLPESDQLFLHLP